jgi:hypothetical protein
VGLALALALGLELVLVLVLALGLGLGLELVLALGLELRLGLGCREGEVRIGLVGVVCRIGEVGLVGECCFDWENFNGLVGIGERRVWVGGGERARVGGREAEFDV